MKELTHLLLGGIVILFLANVLIAMIPKGIRRGLVATISLLTTIITFAYNILETTINLVIKQVSSYTSENTKVRKSSKKPSNVIDIKEKAR